MEVLTESPAGTKLRFNSDRVFERPTGDSVMRVQGQAQDGDIVLDAGYIELDPNEAALVGYILREITDPSPETKERLATEIHALFSRLSGRDAHQIANLATTEWWAAIRNSSPSLGTEREAEGVAKKLAERFERAAATLQAPYATNGGTERD